MQQMKQKVKVKVKVPLSRQRAHAGEDGGQQSLPAEITKQVQKTWDYPRTRRIRGHNLGLPPNHAHSRTNASLLWIAPKRQAAFKLCNKFDRSGCFAPAACTYRPASGKQCDK